jgi:hypothetical protein
MKCKLYVAESEYQSDDLQVSTLKKLGFIFKDRTSNRVEIDIDQTLTSIGEPDRSALRAYVYYELYTLDEVRALESMFDSVDGFEGVIVRNNSLEIYNGYRE